MGGKKRVLIVDDDPDFASAIERIVVSEGYEVEISGDVGQGMKAIETSRPDLILLDVMMEKFDDGFNMCRDLKQDDRYRDIPIIILTAVTEVTGLKFNPETDGDYLQAEALFQKPVSSDVLLRKIKELLGPESGSGK